MARKEPGSPIYQLKVTLQESDPPIWRRILVPATISLGKLHDVLQVAMGWMDCHLHQFVAEGTYYAPPEAQLEDAENENRHQGGQGDDDGDQAAKERYALRVTVDGSRLQID